VRLPFGLRGTWSLDCVRFRVPRFVEHDVVCARDLQHQGHAEPHLLGRSAERRAPTFEISLGGRKVLAHQRDGVLTGMLMGDAVVRLSGGMHTKLARPAPKDQPSRCRLHEGPLEHIAKERSRRGWVIRVDQQMHGSDHGGDRSGEARRAAMGEGLRISPGRLQALDLLDDFDDHVEEQIDGDIPDFLVMPNHHCVVTDTCPEGTRASGLTSFDAPARAPLSRNPALGGLDSGAIVRRVQQHRGVPLLLIAGAPAVGKSSVAWEIFFTLIRSGVPVATLDLDVVGYGPPPAFGSFEMKVRNLGSIWRNYRPLAHAASSCRDWGPPQTRSKLVPTPFLVPCQPSAS
jgi:hypothetical protein